MAEWEGGGFGGSSYWEVRARNTPYNLNQPAQKASSYTIQPNDIEIQEIILSNGIKASIITSKKDGKITKEYVILTDPRVHFRNYEELIKQYQSLGELIDMLSPKTKQKNRFADVEVVSDREK